MGGGESCGGRLLGRPAAAPFSCTPQAHRLSGCGPSPTPDAQYPQVECFLVFDAAVYAALAFALEALFGPRLSAGSAAAIATRAAGQVARGRPLESPTAAESTLQLQMRIETHTYSGAAAPTLSELDLDVQGGE
jgi:hypothetical protein